MDLTLYDDTYREFCKLLPPGRARVLDAACGPGNASRFLMAQRPDLDLLGIDLAPRMVEMARATVPTARFEVHDCRNLAALKRSFDGLICAFGLPYLSHADADTFMQGVSQVIEPNGVLYLSTMLGKEEDSGFQVCSTGDEIYITYYSEEQVLSLLSKWGFRILKERKMDSPSTASKQSTDLVVISRR
jgi:ubiquinone/menaquinone biosynthesis C-methylase UbiE